MGVYIKGIELPKEGSWKTVRIYPDGTCAIPNWQGDCTFLKGAQAVEIPPHGRVIDADALCKTLRSLAENEYTPEVFANWIENHIEAIIPGEESEV